jgi:alpha-glucoside transport system substrate-binding protein
VADILLSTYHATTYENWLDGKLRWTSDDVKMAWKMWGKLMRYGAGINGGRAAALQTGFSDAKHEIASGRCELQHGALSATGLTSTAGYGYTPFPPISGAASPILVSGDFMGLFTDNLNAKELLTYLATPQAQTRWVQQPGGYAFSADQAVKPAAYPTSVQLRIAKLLQPGDSSMLCYSAEDMMLPDMTTAFEHAVLDYVTKPRSLMTLLKGMQKTQQGVGSSPLAKYACAEP